MNKEHAIKADLAAAQKGLDVVMADYEAAVKVVTTQMTPEQRAEHRKRCQTLAAEKRRAFAAVMKAKQ